MRQAINLEEGKGSVTSKGQETDLVQLLTEKKPIWVVNETQKILGSAVVLVLDFGGRKSEMIPPGPEPFPLSQRVPHKKLEECEDLYRLVERGYLRVILDSEAKDYYAKNPNARQILDAKIKSIREVTEGGGIKSFRDMFGKQAVKKLGLPVVSSTTEVLKGKKTEANPKLQWLIQGFEDEVIDEVKFRENFLSLVSSLTDVDKIYLRSKKKAYEVVKDLL